jgi:hypothetical protein
MTSYSPCHSNTASAITAAAKINPTNSITARLLPDRANLGRRFGAYPIFLFRERRDHARRNVSKRSESIVCNTRPVLTVTGAGGLSRRPYPSARRPLHVSSRFHVRERGVFFLGCPSQGLWTESQSSDFRPTALGSAR